MISVTQGEGDQAAPPANPLVLVPGVCGTQLAVRKEGAPGDGDRCWVTLRGADATYQKLWGRYSKDSGLVELLTPGLEVCIPQGSPEDVSGLYAISVLDPDVGFAVAAVHYFEGLITFLQTRGYTPGVTLFGAGYDFRQSCRASAGALLARLQEVSRRCGGRRVDLVTHSMGGLVVRSLLADYPAEFEALVARWVAIGCPFGGAPGYAVDGLITGVQFGGSLGDFFFVQRSTFRQAACQSPSVYELLPPLDFRFAQPPPQLTLWLKTPIEQQQSGPAGQAPLPCSSHVTYTLHSPQVLAGEADTHKAFELQRISLLAPGSVAGRERSGGGSTSHGQLGGGTSSSSNLLQAHQYIFHHDALPGLLTRLLKDNTVSVSGQSIPLPFEPEVWALAQATHEAWKAARLPPSCTFYNLYGVGLSTPYDVQYGTWWYPTQDLDAVPHASASFSYVDGDGTVPAESATAHGMEAAASATINKGAHRDLVGMQEAWDQLLAWLQEPAPLAAAPRAYSCGGMQPSRGGSRQPQESSKLSAGDDENFWNPLVWRGLLS